MSPLERHTAAVESGRINRTNVIGIRKLINAAEKRNRGYGLGMTSPKATVTQTLALRRLIQQREPLVQGELHDSGLKILRSKRWASRFTPREQAIIEELRTFRLVGFDLIGRDLTTSVPVFRASAPSGSFVFRNVPWQAAVYGGDCETGPVVLRDRI